MIGGKTLGRLEESMIAGEDLQNGLTMADEFVGQLMDKVDEAMTVIETVKKIPEYNADLTVMMAV